MFSRMLLFYKRYNSKKDNIIISRVMDIRHQSTLSKNLTILSATAFIFTQLLNRKQKFIGTHFLFTFISSCCGRCKRSKFYVSKAFPVIMQMILYVRSNQQVFPKCEFKGLCRSSFNFHGTTRPHHNFQPSSRC